MFLWRLQTLLPNFFPDLFCLSCQISLRSLPQPFDWIQVILVPSLLLGKETDVQPSIFKWLFFSAAYLFFISVSFFPLLFQSCSSLTAWPWLLAHGNALWLHPGCLAEALPSHGCLNSGPRCLFPPEVTTHLSASSLIKFVPSSSSLCVVWSNESCQPSVSSFFLLFQCSIFIFSK